MRSASLHLRGCGTLFDGDREQLNIAHECIDRHAHGPASHCPSASRMRMDATKPISFRTIAEHS